MYVKLFTALGGLAGCAGVALGALAAHAWRARLDPVSMATLGTASQYLLLHGALLIALAAWLRAVPHALGLRLAGGLIALGTILFGCGLTASALGGWRALAALAPYGGTSLMAGWLALAVYGIWKA